MDALGIFCSVLGSQAERARSENPAVSRELGILKNALRRATPREDFAAPPAQDYASILDAALAAAADFDLAAAAWALAPIKRKLPWAYHYEARSADEDLAKRIAFAELIGPDGPLMAPDIRVGFTLMAPRTFYPLHAHPAVELYWVMSGHAEWTTPNREQITPPGRFVLHRSNEPHAMRTFDEPLLALWVWTGDIDTPSAYI